MPSSNPAIQRPPAADAGLLRSTLALVASVCLLAIAAVGPAGAQTVFNATLDGAQETPPVVTPGFGTGVFILNAAETELSVNVSFSGLVEPANNAHIHQAPPGIPGGVVIPLSFPTATSGSIVQVVSITPDLVTALKDGNLYVNIHSAHAPSGEIRGQILRAEVIPEPGALAMFLPGLAGMGLMARRRRAR